MVVYSYVPVTYCGITGEDEPSLLVSYVSTLPGVTFHHTILDIDEVCRYVLEQYVGLVKCTSNMCLFKCE